MGTRTTDCHKFTPNIFNKNKCSHCFRQREDHSPTALECNRISRKISKCGYLFVAPDWDFSNPIYRTKRWQRRWFVLYDDGELTYSVDDHVETIPQAIVDMTKVVEVSPAEDITGHKYSIAITSPDRVTFIKGSCSEESKFWESVLVTFPKSRGRLKRNMTYPVSKNTKYIDNGSRIKHNTYQKDILDSNNANWLVDSTTLKSGQDENNKNAFNEINKVTYFEPTRKENVLCSKKYSHVSYIDDKKDFNKMFSGMAEQPTRDLDESQSKVNLLTSARKESSNINHKTITYPTKSIGAPLIVSATFKNEKFACDAFASSNDKRRPSKFAKVNPSSQSLERGDPDGGCNLEHLSSNSQTEQFKTPNNQMSEEFKNSKKGWLMKQDLQTGEWTQYWVFLRCSALFYYCDPVSEDRGILHSVLDVSNLKSVSEISSRKTFSFQFTTRDNKQTILSSQSASLKNSWIKALKTASGLNSTEPNSVDCVDNIVVVKEKIDLKNNSQEEVSSDISVENRKQIKLTSTKKQSILLSKKSRLAAAERSGWMSKLSEDAIEVMQTKDSIRSRFETAKQGHGRSKSTPPNARRKELSKSLRNSVICQDSDLESRLAFVEKERDILSGKVAQQESQIIELCLRLERTEFELFERLEEIEKMKLNFSQQLDDSNRSAKNVVDRLANEVKESQSKIKELEKKLSEAIEENEGLYKKIREIKNFNSTFDHFCRNKIKRMDSISILTNLNDIDPYSLERNNLADEYNELKCRFEKVVNEIKVIKKELKLSQKEYDTLEITYLTIKQQIDRKEIEYQSHVQMMADRIQDLTFKYCCSERQVRTLKHKLGKSDRRRSTSLKGKVQLNVAKDIEIKVTELENKVDELEKLTDPSNISNILSNDDKQTPSICYYRRKSLESSSSIDSFDFIMRLNELEKRSDGVGILKPVNVGEVSSASTNSHLLEQINCLKEVLIFGKHGLEEIIHQLLEAKTSSSSSTSSHCVLTNNTEQKESRIEQSLCEITKLVNKSCEKFMRNESILMENCCYMQSFSSIKIALIQIRSDLKNKLDDLIQKRRILGEQNELTPQKCFELTAERIALENVCFQNMNETILHATDMIPVKEKHTESEVSEITQLLCILQTKLEGKIDFNSTNNNDNLNNFLARRLLTISYKKFLLQVPKTQSTKQKIMKTLTLQQSETNVILKRYKCDLFEKLAQEFVNKSFGYTNLDHVIDKVIDEVFRESQKIVHSKLVKSEIENVMMRFAERFEDLFNIAETYPLKSCGQISFEKLCDAVDDTLKNEINNIASELTRCYESTLQKSTQNQWNPKLVNEHGSFDGQKLLSEFADIIAQKVLIDTKIRMLCNEDEVENETSMVSKTDDLSYELEMYNLQDKLTDESLPFACRNMQCITFFKKTIYLILNLEESIVKLNNELSANKENPSTQIKFKNLKDISKKFSELHEYIGKITARTHEITQQPCSNCENLQINLYDVQSQNKFKLATVQQDYTNKIKVLDLQIGEYLDTIKSLENERDSLLFDINLRTSLVEEQINKLSCRRLKLIEQKDEGAKTEEDAKSILQNPGSEIVDFGSQFSKKNIDYSSHKCEYMILLGERDQLYSELINERKKVEKMESRLQMMELEHEKQFSCFQEAYRKGILLYSSDCTNLAEDENFQHRYLREIEQLRTLCEKGLTTMESSHRRIVTELENNHRKEIEKLVSEKDNELAEETKATLAALDAMRKAHKFEVQREVARFKQEFLRQCQHDRETLANSSEDEKLMELRNEILSFSEKYSKKCIQNAALEEKLRSAEQKLKNLLQMPQLELRNRQIKDQPSSSSRSSNAIIVKGLPSTADINCADSEV